MSKITHTEIRMYRMGTGDCFILKFFIDQVVSFKIMIDCGTWSGSSDFCAPFVNDLKRYVDNKIDVLVVTHEHKDHVHVFDVCQELFVGAGGLVVDEIWMAWTEDENDEKVKQWQKKYGNHKKALGKAADALKKAVQGEEFELRLRGSLNGEQILAARRQLSEDVLGFADLQMSLDADGVYAGPLAGMKVVKTKISKKIRYFRPGDVVSNLAGLPGVKIFVLGPPENWEQVKIESGGTGESYDHNKTLVPTDAFAMAILADGSDAGKGDLLPFEASFIQKKVSKLHVKELYDKPENGWRKIDEDWLFSAGALAMRINSITNNLSLALAMEFEESGKVMLFPGDAEYGSWASWHQFSWNEKSKSEGKPFMEDLLNRTVFYKVAHHLSHNGTAKRLGMGMMNHPELVAMATLDYDKISSQWITTMPNQELVQDLVKNTCGRLLVMNPKGFYYDKKNAVSIEKGIDSARQRMMPEEYKAFQDAVEMDAKGLYIQYSLRAGYAK
jgi:hypothetical protein